MENVDLELAHAGQIDWRDADQALRRLAARRAALDADEARWLLVARELRVHEAFGFGSFVEYCERVLGYQPRTMRERLRVAEKLAELPAMTAALASGELSYSAVRELTRIATPEDERLLVDAAAHKTIREIAEQVAERQEPDLRRRSLHLEVAPEVYAMFREARRAIEDNTGERLDDSALVAALCERALRGGAPGSRAPYQIALTVCPRCDRATQDAAGAVIDVPAAVVERARCDAEHVGDVDAETPARLTTDIPTAIRRLVIRRDHGRCTAPGCRAAAFLDLHHVVAREHGGDHAPANLTLLCFAHHQAVHEGRLRLTGRAPDQLRFAHDDGRSYGSDPLADAQRALRELGFPAAIAKAAVDRAVAHTGHDLPIAEFLRACLRECRRPTG